MTGCSRKREAQRQEGEAIGLYDEIWWEAELPASHPPDKRLFQTKSLDPCLDRYVVTPVGRLLLVGNGFQDDAAFAGALPGQDRIGWRI